VIAAQRAIADGRESGAVLRHNLDGEAGILGGSDLAVARALLRDLDEIDALAAGKRGEP
jgi:hypothetical protein